MFCCLFLHVMLEILAVKMFTFFFPSMILDWTLGGNKNTMCLRNSPGMHLSNHNGDFVNLLLIFFLFLFLFFIQSNYTEGLVWNLDEVEHSSVGNNDTLFNSHLPEPNKDDVSGCSFGTRGRGLSNFPMVSWWVGGWGRQPWSCRESEATGFLRCPQHQRSVGQSSGAETGLWLCDGKRQEATEGIAGSICLLPLCVCVSPCGPASEKRT